jgi:hypothetical protein
MNRRPNDNEANNKTNLYKGRRYEPVEDFGMKDKDQPGLNSTSVTHSIEKSCSSIHHQDENRRTHCYGENTPDARRWSYGRCAFYP